MADFAVKGWCPGALRPMASGDGLVLRIRPRLAELSADQMRGIAAAALTHGRVARSSLGRPFAAGTDEQNEGETDAGRGKDHLTPLPQIELSNRPQSTCDGNAQVRTRAHDVRDGKRIDPQRASARATNAATCESTPPARARRLTPGDRVEWAGHPPRRPDFASGHLPSSNTPNTVESSE